MKSYFLLLTGFLLTGCNHVSTSYIQYVNTYVGTSVAKTANANTHGSGTEEYAQTLPAVLVPHGMTFWTPQTQDTEKKCVAPYYYTDDKILGFRSSHWIVGGCTQDYGSSTFMMITGDLKVPPTERASSFSHTTEVSTPAYYKVYLEDYHITVEMTGTSRAALLRFTFDRDTTAWFVFHPNSDENEGSVRILPGERMVYLENPVHRIYQGWGEPAHFSGFNVVTFEKEPLAYGVFSEGRPLDSITHISRQTGAGGYIGFAVKAGEQITVRIGTSFTGETGAKKNMLAEIPDYNFETIRKQTEHVWEQTLGQIKVETPDVTAKKKFYTAMYHAMFLPHTISDVDSFRPEFAMGMKNGGVQSAHNYYEDFSTWDTYRALHPLLNILSPAVSSDMVNSLLDKYREGGWLPIFPCWNSYTAAMIGDHCISVIGDAYIKGVRGFDMEEAYQAMRKNAFEQPATFEEYENGLGRRALQSYLEYGYIPLEDPVKEAFHTNEQVSRTLEYAYDDFVLAQIADALGHTEDADQLHQRAQNFRYVLDPVTGWARGRYADGSFIREFDPFGYVSFITEGYPCHYSFYVPHDPQGLIECMGGNERFIQKLDTLFNEKLYWHGNEPSHQVAFMYNYAGESWKTQREVRKILLEEYEDTPGGLSGNDDAGQMSAWYMFAALGFYPVCPGTPWYMIASPSFTKATIQLENGKTFTLLAPEASEENIYIQSARLNGQEYHKNYFSHEDILNGGTLEFTMGNRPNPAWGNSVWDKKNP
ncbi:MAG: GH92 family glycosyl hydrolase [Tannerellaceae bacterium]|nr:GH92 family glycosyl hydrolase [Tannerellaceae bacterium]